MTKDLLRPRNGRQEGATNLTGLLLFEEACLCINILFREMIFQWIETFLESNMKS